MAQGLGNGEIAEELVVGASTVKTHVSALLDKFGVTNRVQLAVAVAECAVERRRSLNLPTLARRHPLPPNRLGPRATYQECPEAPKCPARAVLSVSPRLRRRPVGVRRRRWCPLPGRSR